MRYLSSLRRKGTGMDEITNFLCVMSNWTEVHIFMDATVIDDHVDAKISIKTTPRPEALDHAQLSNSCVHLQQPHLGSPFVIGNTYLRSCKTLVLYVTWSQFSEIFCPESMSS